MKRKNCDAQGCDKFRWAGKYCQSHQYLRDNSEDIRAKRSFRRGGLRKVSKKRLEEQDTLRGEKVKLREKDVAFYAEIWSERPHYCAVTGVFLGREPLTTFFDHILEKEQYPEFRHCKWNIILLRPDVHADKAKYPELVELRKTLKEQYVNKESLEN